MYELEINKNGQVQQWWINFLTEERSGAVIHDIEARFKEWNADIVIENHLGDKIDKIIFKTEEDLVWFLLHWS
jgi:hypothetical protein